MAGTRRCTGISLASHWRPGRRSRRRSMRVSVLPSRPKTSACASPISPAHGAPRSPTATWPSRSPYSDDRSPRPGQALRLHHGRQRPVFLDPARPGHRVPRPERRREDHHHADDPGPGRADAGLGHRRRPQLPRPAGAHARGGRPPRRQGTARWPPGPRPPAMPGPEQRHPPPKGGRGARHRGSGGRGQAAGEGLLAGHGPAARHRLGAARGPGRAHLRRTGERPRPRRHPLGPDPHADAGRRGPHRACLQPPDERDGPDRRPPAGDRQGPADRRHQRGRVRAVQFPAVGARPQPPGGRAGRPLPPGRRHRGRPGRQDRSRRHGDHRNGQRRGGTAGRHPWHRPGRAHPHPGLAGGGVHGTDPRQRGVPGDGGDPMTDTTIARTGPDHPAAFRAATFGDVLRSEWTKLRSVRSTFWSLTVTVVLGIALGAVISAAAAHGYAKSSVSNKLSWDPTGVSLAGVAIASLVFAAVTFVVGEATSFAAFFAGQAIISGHAPHAALGDPGVARAVAGAGLVLSALAVLSVAAGTLLRHPAAAIACLIAVLLVLPGIAQALPDSWRNPMTEFWPTQAGGQLTSVYHSAHTLGPWPGFGVMCLFVAIVYAIAWTLLDHRDA